MRADEAFFWANYKQAFGGYRSALDVPALRDLGSACYVDASTFKQIDVRQLLFHFDTILLSLPLASRQDESFWSQQKISKADLLYLIEVGRLKIIQQQPEERLDIELLEQIHERNPSAILGRQTAALVVGHDLALTRSDYTLARDDLRHCIKAVAGQLAERLGTPPHELLQTLLWPVAAHLQSIAPLARRGLLGVSVFSAGRLIVDPLKRATGRDYELEAVTAADRVQVAHALKATLIPPLGELATSWMGPSLIIGRQLNFYRHFTQTVAAKWAANERRKEEKRIILPPLPLFAIHKTAPIADLHAMTSRRTTTFAGRALISRLADIPEAERAQEISRLAAELYDHKIKTTRLRLGLDLAGDLAGLAKYAVGAAASAPFCLKTIGLLIETARRVRGCDLLADTLERDIGKWFGRNEDIAFLSKVEPVATLHMAE